MRWSEIRAHYVRLLTESDKTQQEIARDGGITQNSISKLIANTKRGPTVETFVAAVRGLGISLSTFFAQLERLDGHVSSDVEIPQQGGPAKLGSAVGEDVYRQLRQLLKGVRAFAKAVDDEPRDRSKRRRRPRRRNARAAKN